MVKVKYANDGSSLLVNEDEKYVLRSEESMIAFAAMKSFERDNKLVLEIENQQVSIREEMAKSHLFSFCR